MFYKTSHFIIIKITQNYNIYWNTSLTPKEIEYYFQNVKRFVKMFKKLSGEILEDVNSVKYINICNRNFVIYNIDYLQQTPNMYTRNTSLTRQK